MRIKVAFKTLFLLKQLPQHLLLRLKLDRREIIIMKLRLTVSLL